MKKALAIILALLMILSFASLAACGEKEVEKEEQQAENNVENAETPDDGEITEEMLKNSKNNEYVKEKLAAGWDVSIAAFGQNDGYFVGVQLMQAALDMLAEYGFSGTYYAAADASITEQLSQIETAVAENKVAGMMIQTGDPAALQDAVLAAQEAGITVVIYGITTEYDTIIAMTDVYAAGYGAGVMAGDWVSVKYPDAADGEIHVAVMGSQLLPPAIALYQGMIDAAEEDSRMTITYLGDNDGGATEDGYNGAEAALMVDPEIRVFLVYQMAAGLGVNNYLESAGYDLTEFGIFATSEDDTTEAMLEAAANGEGAFRGTIVAGAGVCDTMVNAMVGNLLEGTVPIGTVLIDPMYAWTSSDYTCDYTIGM